MSYSDVQPTCCLHGVFRHDDCTLWSLNKMADILQKTFSNTFPSRKMIVFCFILHFSISVWVELIKTQQWFRNWLGAAKVTSHYLKQCWPWLFMACGMIRPQWIDANVISFVDCWYSLTKKTRTFSHCLYHGCWWSCKDPGHQQLWYWPSSPLMLQFQHQNTQNILWWNKWMLNIWKLKLTPF